MVGIGGSTCGISFKEEFYHSYRDLDTKTIIWKGYLYIDNNDSPNYEKSNQIFKKYLDKIDSVLDKHKRIVSFVTCGPFF